MDKEELKKYVEEINERIHDKLKDDEEVLQFYSRLVVGFNAICEENQKLKEVIDKVKHILNNQFDYYEYVDIINDIENTLNEVSK